MKIKRKLSNSNLWSYKRKRMVLLEKDYNSISHFCVKMKAIFVVYFKMKNKFVQYLLMKYHIWWNCIKMSTGLILYFIRFVRWSCWTKCLYFATYSVNSLYVVFFIFETTKTIYINKKCVWRPHIIYTHWYAVSSLLYCL